MPCRRQFIKNSAIGAILISGTLPHAFKALDNISSEQYQREFSEFMSLSYHLTGFDDLDTELGSYFFSYLKAQIQPELWRHLLEQFSTRQDKQSIAAIMSDATVWGLAKSVTKLWYSGWLTETHQIPTTIKSKAYQQALAWKALETHAKGQTTNQLWQQATQKHKRENNDNI